MERIDQLVDRIVQGLALVGALGVIALLLHVGADVLSRNLLDKPIPATNEIASRYYMVAIAFLPLAWIERSGGMVRVELLESFLSERAMKLSELTVIALCFVIYGMLTYVTWQAAMRNYASGTFVDVLGHKISVWPSYFMLPVGFGLSALTVALRPITLFRKRD